MGKGYGVELFWKDLAKILMRAGTSEGKNIFIFSDTQIIKESFLEDINNILNNGEVPNLFKDDEIALIHNTLKETSKDLRDAANYNLESKDGAYQFFVARIRDNLRIVLCFSPVGDNFRNRCRQFPSIINCCTIDWFNLWPEDALFSVADRYLSTNTSIANKEGLIPILSKVILKIHSEALTLATQFLKEQRRNYYITPTSYLEFLKILLDIYVKKMAVIPKSIQNYTMGIQKLEDANYIVANLKADLITLQPQLVVSKKEIEILINNLEEKKGQVDIEKNKIQGDKDKAQIERDKIAEIKDECDAELKLAKPALDEAKEALDSLNEGDLAVLRNFKEPSIKIVDLGKCVCYIYDRKGNGWSDFKSELLRGKAFLEDCNNTEMMVKKLNDPRKLKELGKLFDAIVGHDYLKISSVCVGLKKWVGAMLIYVEKWRIVKPKMVNLEKASAELKVVEDDLFEKSRFLQSKIDELDALTKSFNAANNDLKNLERKIENIEVKLKRSARLVDGLKNEGIRWKENILKLQKQEHNLLANVILSASVVGYAVIYNF